MNSLIKSYQQRLNLKDATFSRIEHEDALVAIVYKVMQLNGSEHILKICTRPHDYAREVYFLKRFADRLPVPKIIQLIEPDTGINGAILMQCLSGRLLKSADFTEILAFELGALLGRIHLNRAEGYGDIAQPQSLNSDSRSYFTFKFAEGVMECSNHLPEVLLEKCHHFYDSHINLLASVDGPCITHRDFRPGNVMIHEGKLQGIIDWASARVSFAEEDFCPLELGQCSTTDAHKRSFLTGYASIRPVPDYSRIMPLLLLSKAIATIGFTIKTETWENKNALLYQFHRQFLDEFFSRYL